MYRLIIQRQAEMMVCINLGAFMWFSKFKIISCSVEYGQIKVRAFLKKKKKGQ